MTREGTPAVVVNLDLDLRLVVVAAGEGADGDDDDLSVYTRGRFHGLRVASCDGRQLDTPLDLARVRAHRAAWRAALVADGGGATAAAALVRFCEADRAGAPLPGPAPWWKWWLVNGGGDVVLLGGPHDYAVHRGRALPRLLALTAPLEMNLPAMWAVLDDLGVLRVHGRGGRGDDDDASSSSTVPLLNRNVKALLPNGPTDFVVAACGVLVLLWLAVARH